MDIGLILIGAFVFLALIVGILLLFLFFRRFRSQVRLEKVAHEGKSRVIVQTFIPIARATIEDMVDGEPMVIVRENVKPGEKLEFVYPLSENVVKLTVEGDENFTMEEKLRA
ncbi:MAG: hypothetical protein PHC52_12420 [Syntrophales bacterium]|nr:hypothetical protein [Candidatus ainarchaeum sp.]MDD5096327.1 hypothetical protein [Candidatus ainarchaeum sp.]MDD5533590.1 hypothetical protein [Syntrophales bacterium]